MGYHKGSVPWNKGLTFETDSRIPRPWLGKHRAEETKQKIREKHIGLHHTKKAKMKISEALKGNKNSKGKVPWNYGLTKDQDSRLRGYPKGKPRSKKTKKKISEALKGRQISEKTKRKMSRGQTKRFEKESPWNKGLTKETDDRIAKRSENVKRSGIFKGDKNAFYGKHHSKKSRQKISEVSKRNWCSTEFRRKASERMKGKQIHKGHHHSKASKEKMSKKRKKWYETHPHPKGMLGKHFSEEHKKKLSKARLKQVLPTKDTSIEVKMQKELKMRGIAFETHLRVGFWQPDIVFPRQKVIIECDGDYWHNRPERKARDKALESYCKKRGWKIYRFWEHDINKDTSACVDQIMECL